MRASISNLPPAVLLPVPSAQAAGRDNECEVGDNLRGDIVGHYRPPDASLPGVPKMFGFVLRNGE